MTDPKPFPEPGNDDPARGAGAPGGRPGWTLVFGVVLVILLLGLMVFLHLSGAFGPGVH
jgi:hypothetical protein